MGLDVIGMRKNHYFSLLRPKPLGVFPILLAHSILFICDRFWSVGNRCFGWIVLAAGNPDWTRGINAVLSVGVLLAAIVCIREVIRRCWVAWMGVQGRAHLLETGIVRTLRSSRTVLHVRGVDFDEARTRAKAADTAWSVCTESQLLCPLPDWRLSPAYVVILPLAGVLFLGLAVFTWTQVPSSLELRFVYDASALVFLVACVFLFEGCRWAIGMPFSWGHVTLMPRKIEYQGICGSKKADTDTDELFVHMRHPRSSTHLVIVLPRTGAPWCLDVPGRAIDLVLGAWLAPEPNR